MIEKILSALEKSGVKQYQVTETTKESAELFFIKKNLDMQRMAEVRQAEVVVYQEFWEGEKHCLGSSSVMVQESFTEEEMEKLDIRIEAAARDFVKLRELMEEKEEKEKLLEEKMERWMYLNELADRIAADR